MTTAESFIHLYDQEYNYGDFWKYEGISDGLHQISRFKLMGQSLPVKIDTKVISIKDLPPTFPEHPQKDLVKYSDDHPILGGGGMK